MRIEPQQSPRHSEWHPQGSPNTEKPGTPDGLQFRGIGGLIPQAKVSDRPEARAPVTFFEGSA